MDGLDGFDLPDIPKRKRKILKKIALGAGVFFVLIIAWALYVYFEKTDDRTGGAALSRFRPALCREIYSQEREVLDYACPMNGIRIWAPLSKIDSKLRQIVVSLEDAKFYNHPGLDLKSIWDAAQHDLETKSLSRGGSTITQQLAKNLFLTREKTLLRKASEVPLALRLEKELSKEQILELYLNTIEWGPGIFGVEAASRAYFDKPAADLTQEQAWLLGLMIPNPIQLNLWEKPAALKSMKKRAGTLARHMVASKKMSDGDAKDAEQHFENFLAGWMASKPTPLSGLAETRTYPSPYSFRFASLIGKKPPETVTIERVLQRKLEALLPASAAGVQVVWAERGGKAKALVATNAMVDVMELTSKLVEAGETDLEIKRVSLAEWKKSSAKDVLASP